MIDPEFIGQLCCPETRQALHPAEPALVDNINQLIKAGILKNRGGQTVLKPIQGGLVRSDGKFLYPLREDIPIMLVEEALPLEGQLN